MASAQAQADVIAGQARSFKGACNYLDYGY